MALLLGEKVLSEAMGRGLGKGGLKTHPGRRLTDDGKRSLGVGRCAGIASRRECLKKGKGFGEGGARDRTGAEANGLF